MKAPDSYTWRARVAPVLLVATPPLTLAAVLAPTLSGAQRLWSLALALLALLAAQYGRDAGRRLQPQLWASWGGAPTTSALRWRDSDNRTEQQRRHQRLQLILGEVPRLPDEAEESADPVAADQIYATAARVLMDRVRGDRDRFPLVQAENASYGFRRNIHGLAPAGFRSCLVTLVLAAAVGLLLVIVDKPVWLLGLPAAVAIAGLLLWRRASAAWVRPVADAYAYALFGAVEPLADDLERQQSTS